MNASTSARTASGLERMQWMQLGGITVAAIALYVALRLLPTGTNLSHMDFRVDPKGGAALEFCDPTNPQFIPVVAMRSPVVMSVQAAEPPMAGQLVRGTVFLQTASGKPIAPEDLQYVHTRKLHLLIIDPTLTDYQHVHPEPTRKAGEWSFSFRPRGYGAYRVFADFTPAATSRGLYASADLEVAKGSAPPGQVESGMLHLSGSTVESEGVRYTLAPSQPVRAGQSVDWKLSVARSGAATLNLEPVMDALAHLVAFDGARSGFAHLHPVASDILPTAEAASTMLLFKLTIPKPGRYVIWAQLKLEGRETFVPFWFEVL